jgi:predicted peptidase
MPAKAWKRFPCLVLLVFCTIFVSNVWSFSKQENPDILLKIIELKSGSKLRYTLAFPSEYSPVKTYPLVIALHYGGKVTPFYGFEFLISFVKPALKELDALLVAPDCPAMGWTNTTSEEAVLELILFCMETYRIDPGRVLMLGFSMGGLGTWYMVGRHPDIFSAAIPIAATADAETTPVIENVPLYVIHGEKDEVFPLDEVKKLYEKQKAGGADIQFMVVEKASHNDLARYITPLQAAVPWIRRIWKEHELN